MIPYWCPWATNTDVCSREDRRTSGGSEESIESLVHQKVLAAVMQPKWNHGKEERIGCSVGLGSIS
jgi:hypothetical protein